MADRCDKAPEIVGSHTYAEAVRLAYVGYLDCLMKLWKKAPAWERRVLAGRLEAEAAAELCRAQRRMA